MVDMKRKQEAREVMETGKMRIEMCVISSTHIGGLS